MATDSKQYVKSDAKVKAAQSKLSSIKADIAKLQGSKNLAGASDRLKELNSAATAAQTELDSAKSAAQDYFNANKESILAKEKASKDKKEAAQKAESAASVKSIAESGLVDPAVIAAIQKDQASFNAVKPAGTVIGNPPPPPVQVEDWKSTLKNARQELKKMNPDARYDLATKLDAAGYAVPLTKEYTDDLYIQYKAAIAKAQADYGQYKEFPTLSTFLDDAIRQKKAITAAGGGPGGTNTDVTYFDPTRAANYVSTEIKQLLQRDATQKEIDTLSNKLINYQRSHPSVTTTDAKGNRVTKAGPDAAGFIDSEIKKLNKDKKTGLSEYDTKQLSKAQSTNEAVVKTAAANGVVASEDQIKTWTKRIQNGEDPATIQHEIRNMAAIGRPEAIAKQLAAGNDLGTILSPYKQYMQSILEVPADQINVSDPTLQMAIAGDKPMSLYDYQNALRKDPRWQYTNNAKTAVSDTVSQVLKDFGFMG